MMPSGDPSAQEVDWWASCYDLIFVAFWFLLIAPQRKKQRADKMIKALEKVPKENS